MKALLFLSVISLPLFAQPLEVEMTGFQFNYAAPSGTGSAESFYRNMKSTDAAVEVSVEKVDEALSVQIRGVEEHDFLIKKAPSIIQDARFMTIEGMNLRFREALSLGLQTGEFTSTKDILVLDRFNLNCDRHREHAELIDQVVSGCVKNLGVKAAEFNSEKTKIIVSQILSEGTKSDVRIRNLDLKSKNGSYELSANVKAQVSGTAKSKGTLSYDAQKGVLTIKVNEFKFGILGVRGMLFKELKKQQSDTMKVSEPYVYITVKKSASAPNQ